MPLLTHYRQERDYTCTPACVRMVLAFHGLLLREAECISLLETDETGTAFSRIENLRLIGFRVEVHRGTRDDLLAVTATGLPIITAVHTLLLPTYPPPGGAHSVAVASADGETVTLFDPYRATAPDIVPLEAFEAAWRRRYCWMARITPAAG